MRKGATNDGSSAVTLEAYQTCASSRASRATRPAIRWSRPSSSCSRSSARANGGRENVLVRGVEPVALAVHDEVKIVEGRMFEPSTGEVIVGRGVAGRYVGAELGAPLEFGRGTWKVVGVFESGGTSFESEVWVRRARARERRQAPGPVLRPARARRGRRRHRRARAPDRRRSALCARGDARARVLREAGGVGERALLHRGGARACSPGSARPSAPPTRSTPPCRRAPPRSARCARSASRAATILGSFLIESLRGGAARLRAGRRAAPGRSGALISCLLGGVAFASQTFTTNVIRSASALGDLAMALALSLVIGLVGGIFPALRASRLRPVEALRKA